MTSEWSLLLFVSNQMRKNISKINVCSVIIWEYLEFQWEKKNEKLIFITDQHEWFINSNYSYLDTICKMFDAWLEYYMKIEIIFIKI